MASAGLAQIDENSSLASGNDQPLLPNLLRRQVPQPVPENVGEKTPELWPAAYGEIASPSVVWPSTPTPHAVGTRSWNAFSIGDSSQDFKTECAPSFSLDEQQTANVAGVQFMMQQVPAIATPMTPLWPGQPGLPGIALTGNMHFGVYGSPVPPTASQFFSAQASAETSRTEGKDASGVKRMPPPSKAKSGQTSHGESACPVAVYVDLSALKERPHVAGRGLGSRR